MVSTSSAQEWERGKKTCFDRLDLERKQHRIEDIKNTLTFTLIGLVLFLIHFPLGRKQSRS